jgi:hypothetical protein
LGFESKVVVGVKIENIKKIIGYPWGELDLQKDKKPH